MAEFSLSFDSCIFLYRFPGPVQGQTGLTPEEYITVIHRQPLLQNRNWWPEFLAFFHKGPIQAQDVGRVQ